MDALREMGVSVGGGIAHSLVYVILIMMVWAQ